MSYCLRFCQSRHPHVAHVYDFCAHHVPFPPPEHYPLPLGSYADYARDGGSVSPYHLFADGVDVLPPVAPILALSVPQVYLPLRDGAFFHRDTLLAHAVNGNSFSFDRHRYYRLSCALSSV